MHNLFSALFLDIIFIIPDLVVLTNDSPALQVFKDASFLPFDIYIGKQECDVSIAYSSFFIIFLKNNNLGGSAL